MTPPITVVFGRFHPRAVEGDAERNKFGTPSFRPDEVEHALREFKNVPVYIEHNPEMEVGHVEDTFLDDQGCLQCEIHINPDAKYAGLAMKAINEKSIRGLSTGFEITRSGLNGPIHSIEGMEISLVEEGKLPQTDILAYGDGVDMKYVPQALQPLLGDAQMVTEKVHNSKRAYFDIFLSADPPMATQQQSGVATGTSASSTAAPAAHAPAPAGVATPAAPAAIPRDDTTASFRTAQELAKKTMETEAAMQKIAEEREAKAKEIEALRAENAAFKAEKQAAIERELVVRRSAVAEMLKGNETTPGLFDVESAEFPLPPKEKLQAMYSELTKGPEDGPITAEGATQMVMVTNSLKNQSRFVKQKFDQALTELEAAKAAIAERDGQIALLTEAVNKHDASFTVLNSKDDRSRKRDVAQVSSTTPAATTTTPQNKMSFAERFRETMEDSKNNVIRGIVTNHAGSEIQYFGAAAQANPAAKAGNAIPDSWDTLFSTAMAKPPQFIPRNEEVKAANQGK